MRKGIFISFEGNEGSGKTSVLTKVSQRLRDEGYDIFVTREPGGNKIAEEIRKVILDKTNTSMDAHTETLLYAASRRQHLVETVLPRLERGEIVISDRFVDSSLAYQGYARGVGIDKVYDINVFATDNTMPELTIFFDIDPEEGLKRIAKNDKREVNRLDVEKMDFHKKVHEAYEIIAEKFKDRFKVIDASRSFDEVSEEVYKILKNYIDNRA